MTQKLTTSLIAICLATVVSTSAYARPNHLQADTNQDGEISLTEFTAESTARFTAIDTDADGRLSEAERKSHHQLRKSQLADHRFQSLDSNGDGSISRDEFEQATTQHKPKHMKMKMARMHMKGKMHDQRQKADANGDGYIDRAEFEAHTTELFALRDANADGVLSKADHEFRKKNHSGHH